MELGFVSRALWWFGFIVAYSFIGAVVCSWGFMLERRLFRYKESRKRKKSVPYATARYTEE